MYMAAFGLLPGRKKIFYVFLIFLFRLEIKPNKYSNHKMLVVLMHYLRLAPCEKYYSENADINS